MQQDRVQQIADGQVAQWAEFTAASAQRWGAAGAEVATGGGGGAYWPLGAEGPSEVPDLSQIRVIAVRAVGQSVRLDIVSPDDEAPVSVLIDLSEASGDEPDDMVHTLIFARVAELVGSPAWAGRPKGPSSMTLRL